MVRVFTAALLCACLTAPGSAYAESSVSCGSGKRGTVVAIHGGGFVFPASPEYLRTLCREFGGRRYRAVAVGYEPGSYSAAWRAARRAIGRARGPVYVYGESVGGTIAARAALELDIAAAAVVSAPTNLLAWRRNDRGYWDLLGMSRTDRRRASPLFQRLPRSRPPVLVAHNRRDEVVDIAQSRRFAKRLATRLKPLPGGHLMDPAVRAKSRRFFIRHATHRRR